MSVKRARESKNLLDPAQLETGYYAFADGIRAYGNTWGCSGIMPVVGNTIYSFTQKTPSRYYGIVWWDSNGNFISSASSQTSQQNPTITTTSPSSAAYAAVDIGGYPSSTDVVHPTELEELMFCEGNPQTYEPYGATIWEPCAVKRYTSREEMNTSVWQKTYKANTLTKNGADLELRIDTTSGRGASVSTDQFYKDNCAIKLAANETYAIKVTNNIDIGYAKIVVRYLDTNEIITSVAYGELPEDIMLTPSVETYIYFGVDIDEYVGARSKTAKINVIRQPTWHDTPVYVRQNGVWVEQT